MDKISIESVIEEYRGLSMFFGVVLKDVNDQGLLGSAPIHCAVIRGNIAEVQVIVNAGANLNLQGEDGFSAIHYAVLYNNPEITEFLIKNGADLNIANNDGDKPIDLAKLSDNQKLVALIRMYSPD